MNWPGSCRAIHLVDRAVLFSLQVSQRFEQRGQGPTEKVLVDSFGRFSEQTAQCHLLQNITRIFNQIPRCSLAGTGPSQ